MPRSASGSRFMAQNLPIALLTDGATCDITSAASSALAPTAVSVGGWFNLAHAQVSGQVYGLIDHGDGTNGWTLQLFSGTGKAISWRTQSTHQEVGALGDLVQGTWNHIAVGNDASGNAQVYLNGSPYGPLLTAMPTIVATSLALFVGARQNAGVTAQWYWGQIADVRVYNTRLNDSQMKAWCLTGNSGLESTNMLLRWSLQEGTLTTAHGTGSLALNGTINGTSAWTTNGPLSLRTQVT